jgi:hypothetical protein
LSEFIENKTEDVLGKDEIGFGRVKGTGDTAGMLRNNTRTN